MKTKKRILLAILNWGLGHATRCIPLIQELLRQNAEVILAADGAALDLIQKEFPTLETIALPAYNITYRTSNMWWNIGTQFPKIAKAVFQEHQAIEKIVEDKKIDIIISDNRYGCYSKRVKSIFMTHQLHIKLPNALISKQVERVNRSRINRFDECWVPDFEGSPNLSGTLSHGTSFENVKYIGALSRMKYFESNIQQDIIVVLSGPEPQRTKLEEKIIEQAVQLPQGFLIVRGITTPYSELQLTSNVKVISLLTSNDLNKAILESKIVVNRSGYSSLMDLVKLRKKAILIPTPGQTEQEYLANHFHQQGIFYTQSQKELNLKEAIEKVNNFSGFGKEQFPESHLKVVVEDLINS